MFVVWVRTSVKVDFSNYKMNSVFLLQLRNAFVKLPLWVVSKAIVKLKSNL